MKKCISIVIPTYNEVDNVVKMVEEIRNIFTEVLKQYDYGIVFIDNCSTDGTRELIRKVAMNDNRVKAIFNSANFGGVRSPIYGLREAPGDCAILMAADFQEPPEMIPSFVKAWEEGYKVVAGVKQPVRESFFISICRKSYYRFIEKMSETKQIDQFTGFGLYDRVFIDELRKIDDPMPYLKGIVAEIGFERKEIEYEQGKRTAGKSKYNFWRLYDYAMLGITSNTKTVMRMATIFGFSISVLSVLIAIVYFLLKIFFWTNYSMGMASLVIGVFFIGGVQLFFLGLLGEYVMTINTRVVKRPLVIEEERINF